MCHQDQRDRILSPVYGRDGIRPDPSKIGDIRKMPTPQDKEDLHRFIVMYGRDNAEHDKNLLRLMQIAKEKGLVFNSKKCAMKTSEIIFFGSVYGKDGIRPDPSKIGDIRKMPTPQNKEDLQRFIVMYGRDNAEHDKNLLRLMQIAKEKGLVFTSKKCAIKTSGIIFFGPVYGKDGIRLDPRKKKTYARCLPHKTRKICNGLAG